MLMQAVFAMLHTGGHAIAKSRDYYKLINKWVWLVTYLHKMAAAM